MLEALRRAHVVERLVRFVYQFLYGLAWIYATILQPILRPFFRFASWVAKLWYWYVWDKTVYTKTGRFSKIRAGWVILATAGVVYLALPQRLGGAFLLGDTLTYLVTKNTEEVELKPASEIDYAHDIWSVSGTLIDPNDPYADATEDNSVYFRVQNSLFNELWSLLHRGGLFYPDYVAGPTRFGKCRVTNYGIRRKFLRQQWNVYPDALDIQCGRAK